MNNKSTATSINNNHYNAVAQMVQEVIPLLGQCNDPRFCQLVQPLVVPMLDILLIVAFPVESQQQQQQNQQQNHQQQQEAKHGELWVMIGLFRLHCLAPVRPLDPTLKYQVRLEDLHRNIHNISDEIETRIWSDWLHQRKVPTTMAAAAATTAGTTASITTTTTTTRATTTDSSSSQNTFNDNSDYLNNPTCLLSQLHYKRAILQKQYQKCNSLVVKRPATTLPFFSLFQETRRFITTVTDYQRVLQLNKFNQLWTKVSTITTTAAAVTTTTTTATVGY